MKTLKQWTLIAIVAWVLASRAYPQGTVRFNRTANGDASPAAAVEGLVFLVTALLLPPPSSEPVPLDEDINFELWGGPDVQTLQPIHTWRLSDNSTTGIAVGGGGFADPSAGVSILHSERRVGD